MDETTLGTSVSSGLNTFCNFNVCVCDRHLCMCTPSFLLKLSLGIESLLEVRTELREASLAWFNLGLALGLLRHTLESTHSHDISHNLSETLAAWLQGRDGVAGPTWRAIVKALLSPAIGFYRLALQISKAHQCSGSSLMTCNEDPALQDVDNAKLGKPLGGYCC